MVDAASRISTGIWPPIRLSDGRGIREQAASRHLEHRRNSERSSQLGSPRALTAQSPDSVAHQIGKTGVNTVDLGILNPTVKAAIDALQKGDKQAWASLFEPDAMLYDDGNPRSLASFTQDALGHERFTSIDRVENRGLDLTGSFHSDQWGDFRTYFRFHLSPSGKIRRLDIGQAN
jgi:hypothetical protein